jgi:hypothetical protein
MALTVSTIISDVQALLDDPSNPTFAQILRFLNRGRQTLARDVPWYEKETSYSSSTSTYQLSLPSDCNKVKSVMFRDVDNETRVAPLSEREWQQFDQSATGTSYTDYFEYNFQIWMTPRIQANADTSTLVGGIGAGDTSLILLSTVKLATIGKIIIDNEVIYYNGKDNTTGTLQNLVRGQEGTTAASHLDGATATERDIIVTYYAVPADLTSGQVDQIFEINPDVLVYFCAWQSKIKDTDDTNSSANFQMQMFQQNYLKAVAEMKYNLRSRKDGPMKTQEVV